MLVLLLLVLTTDQLLDDRILHLGLLKLLVDQLGSESHLLGFRGAEDI